MERLGTLGSKRSFISLKTACAVEQAVRKILVSLTAVLCISACVEGGPAPAPYPYPYRYYDNIRWRPTYYGLGYGCNACSAAAKMSPEDRAFARQNVPRGGGGMGGQGGAFVGGARYSPGMPGASGWRR